MDVGSSRLTDSRKAGAEAAREALRDRTAQLIIVFCSHAHDLPALLEGIRAESKDAPLMGCSTAGEIAADGPGDAGVVVTAIGGEGFSISVSAAENASIDLRAAGSDAARCLDRVEDKGHKVLLLLTDGLAGDQQEIVRGAYAVAGAGIPLVGGCAGDDLEMTKTYQFFNDKVLSDAVVGAAISSDGPLGIGVRHGWKALGDPVLVTRSEENRVYSLDDRPALDVYLERLDAPAEVRTDAASFTRFAMTHPLGLSRRNTEPHVRFISGANFDDRSLQCIAAVPQGGFAWFMRGDESSVLSATDEACGDALSEIARPVGLFAFDCIARRGILGDQGIKAEVSRISEHGGGVPVAGFYTYGEIARTQGLSGFHNQTLVVLAIG
jgi:hypothetical protein